MMMESQELMDREQSRVDDEKAATPEIPGIGHNVGGGAGQRLTSFIERVERLEEEKSNIAEDIKEVYAESKGVGFDVKIIRRIIKLRKMDPDTRREESELESLYMSAIGMV